MFKKTITKGWMLIVSLSLMFVLSGISFGATTDVPRMSTQDLKAHVDKGDVIVLDVRTEHDWKTSDTKIKGAVHEEPSRIASWVDKYPKDKTLVFYCA